MKALVTGGAGFIGSHIAEALAGQGAHVIVLDNLSLGSSANLAWIQPSQTVEFVEGDCLDGALVRRLIAGCDWVFHEGALPSVPRSVEAPLESNRQNIDGTLGMLVAARDAGVKRFLFASSSSIYGDAEVPLKHEALPPLPLSPYALQKYAGERYCQLFHQLYGLPTVALRYFNVFGPRQRADSPYSGVIAKFCTAFLAGQAPVIHGDGRQSRDFTYVANAVAANLAAAAAPATNVAGRVFNIACGDSVDLLQLVADLRELTGRELAPTFGPPRAGDVRHSRADLAAARAAFNFAPVVGWKEGLRRTLDWYRAGGV
jgi:nucleoside-diphosphate-sugar epimerase